MPVNVKLLKKVRKLIAEEPRRLDMDTWGRRYEKQAVQSVCSLPPCGTVACLAGWTLLASKPKRKWASMFYGFGEIRGNSIPTRAARLLGLTIAECPFFNVMWDAPDVLAWIDRQIDAASK